MNFIQRFISWLIQPFLDSLREEMHAEMSSMSSLWKQQTQTVAQQAELDLKKTDLQLRKDIHAELRRVGLAISEIQKRAIPKDLDNLDSLGERLTLIERALEPRKPGNHIEPGHEFGNKIRWNIGE
jgi:hypothetical protein